MSNKKKVNFKREVLVYIVESLKKENLWWTDNENNESLKEASNEIKELMSIHESMKKSDALRLLYQPGNICYKEEFFSK